MEERKMKQTISKTINKTLEDRLVAQVSQDGTGHKMAVIGRKTDKADKAAKAKASQSKK